MALGLLAGAAVSLGKKLLGKAVSKATKGKLLGAGGGKELLKTGAKVLGGVTTVAAAMPVIRSATATMSPSPFSGGGSMANLGDPGQGGTIIEVSPTGRRMKKRWKASEGRYVAVRHLNVLNPRALRRALSRAEGFERFAKRTVNALHTGPKKFKSTRKRKR